MELDVTDVGAPGIVVGVALTAVDELPVPAELTARIFTLYVVPLASAVVPFVDSAEITNGLDVLPTVRVCQVAPPSVEY